MNFDKKEQDLFTEWESGSSRAHNPMLAPSEAVLPGSLASPNVVPSLQTNCTSFQKVSQELQSLYGRPPSTALKAYFDTLQSPKPLTHENFTQGLKAFMEIANLNSREREQFYGTSLGGVHYNNDFLVLLKKVIPAANDLKAKQLNGVYPPSWRQGQNTPYNSLMRQGTNLAMALNDALQGPTVIDCGMFCQLAFWFAIRYVLGDAVFNELFGATPFYLTQSLYDAIRNPEQPDHGNPLYFFFKEILPHEVPTVGVMHFANHRLYPLKHPGGNYSGDNGIVIDGLVTIFDPELSDKSNLSFEQVEALLRKVYNTEPDANDRDTIAIYRDCMTQNSQAIHPHLDCSFEELIESAELFSEHQVDEKEWKSGSDNNTQRCRLQFDLEGFKQWVSQTQQMRLIEPVDYQPISQNAGFESNLLNLNPELLEKIPFENRNYSFDRFKTDTPLQQELLAIAKCFCHDVMQGQSAQVILTGNAGIGKTATAVACYKELVNRGKAVLWLSEVTAHRWAEGEEGTSEHSESSD